MSFNIRMGCGHSDPFKLAKGSLGYLPKCAEVIRKHNPDVCGLQEVDRKSKRAGFMDQSYELAQLCGMQESWVEKIKDYGVATLFKERPFSVSKVLMKGSIHTRVLMINEYEDCVIANTHFPLKEAARTNAANIVCAALKPYAAKKPVFLMGDINAKPDSPTIRIFEKDFKILTDVTKPTFPAKGPKVTIDYIMVDKAHAENYNNVKAYVDAAPEATDHAALIVELE
jgi:endonuclease/exonuclease/phosphatase family metal-dependent hydrolase